MFGKGFRLFRLMGFEVRVDLSWLVIAVLVTWTLAAGFFPMYHEGLSAGTYWWMGLAGALGLFVSIIFHEFGHSIIARQYGIPIKGITLFIFGGVAEMDREPPTPKSEFMMAIAGPIASVLIAGVFWGVGRWADTVGVAEPITAVLYYLAWINLILVAFNLVPAFPLDGGRVLRSLLWAWKKRLRWATRIASSIGSGFGLVLIALGIFSVITGNIIGGIWWFLIGMFLRGASQMSYQQLLLRRALEGEPVRRFMHSHPVSVSPGLTIQEMVDDYVYRHHHKMFPVVEDGQLVGCISVDQIKNLPREEWPTRSVRDVAVQCSDENTIEPEADAVEALSTMNRTRASRLMVVDHGQLVGVLALKDLLNFLSLKIELEGQT